MRWIASALLVASAWLGVIGAKVESPVQTFSKLPAGDILEIDFKSSGCFSHSHYELAFGRTPSPSVSVIEFTDRWINDQEVVTEPKFRGISKLSGEDLAQLDRLLSFYRGPKTSGCTTVDTIVVGQVRNGRTIASESFEDGSCRTLEDGFIDGKKRFLTFNDIVGRLNKK